MSILPLWPLLGGGGSFSREPHKGGGFTSSRRSSVPKSIKAACYRAAHFGGEVYGLPGGLRARQERSTIQGRLARTSGGSPASQRPIHYSAHIWSQQRYTDYKFSRPARRPAFLLLPPPPAADREGGPRGWGWAGRPGDAGWAIHQEPEDSALPAAKGLCKEAAAARQGGIVIFLST